MIYTYGEKEPEGFHYTIFHNSDGSAMCYPREPDLYARYKALYGSHSKSCPDLQWCYDPPAGMPVATGEWSE